MEYNSEKPVLHCFIMLNCPICKWSGLKMSLNFTTDHNYTVDSKCSCRWLYQNFSRDIRPLPKGTFFLQRTSSGIKFKPLKEDRKRYFSTPSWLHIQNCCKILFHFKFHLNAQTSDSGIIKQLALGILISSGKER